MEINPRQWKTRERTGRNPAPMNRTGIEYPRPSGRTMLCAAITFPFYIKTGKGFCFHTVAHKLFSEKKAG